MNRILHLCEDLSLTCEPFSSETEEVVPQQVIDKVFEVLSFAVEYCARGLFKLIGPINSSDGYYLERTFFWDIVLCYHMCLVAKVRLSEMRANQSAERPVPWQNIVDLFQDLWSPAGIHAYYPDFRFQCLYTTGRLFQLRNLFYLDYGVISKSTTDVFMQVIESFTPKKYQFTRSGGISEEYIRNDHESMAIPFLVAVIVFFRIGLYYQCTVCIQDDEEYELMIDLYARRYKLHSQNPICKMYLEYVIQFFTKINPGMSVVAVNEFIMRNFYFSNSNLDAMNIPYRTCRVQIFTVCDAWRNKRFRKADISGIMLLMQFIKSQMAFHREVIQCPVNFFMMVFHRNTLAAEIEPLATKRRSAQQKVSAALTKPTEVAEADGDQDPEPAEIVKSPDDPDEADKVLQNNITTNPMNDLAQRAILGKRSVKSMLCNTPLQGDQVPLGQGDGVKVQKKKNRSSVSFFLDSAAAKESKAANEFANNVLTGEVTQKPASSSVNLSWFSFLVRSTAIFDNAAAIGAIMSSPRLLPHEKAVMRITGLYGQPARRFLASWRFAVLVGHPMGMTAEDECMLLIVLHDFCKQLGPSTLLNAVRKACLSRPIIPYIALLWKRFTSYTWAPISSQEAIAQHKAITRRLGVFEIPQVTNLEYLLYCPVCGFVRTIYNSAMKIDSTEELRVVDGHKVMGFSGVKVYMLPLNAIEVMCARTGLLVSTICQGTRCLYVPTRYRIVYRAEQSQQWRVCGYCGILSMRDCESYFALYHPKFGELCSHCSLKYSRVKLKKDDTVFQYQSIRMNEYPGFEDVLKGEV